MRINPVTALLAAAFFYPVIRGFIKSYSSDSLKKDLCDMESDISFIISLVFGLLCVRRIFIQHEDGIYKLIYDRIPAEVIKYLEIKPFLLYAAVLPIFVLVLYYFGRLVFSLINYLLFFPLLDKVESMLDKSSRFNQSMVGAFFELPKAVCSALFVAFILNFASIMNVSSKLNLYLEESKTYNYLCQEVVIPVSNSRIARQLPNIINNSLKIEIKQASGDTDDIKLSRGKAIIYYNGVTLEEGVKSNSSIDKFAKELVAGETTDKGKAKKIYTWIGSNISYDNEKAKRVLNNDFNIASGAIPAFEDNSGICFDFACLYVAMSRAVGLKVKLVTGEGFNGASWVSHAWNQVYVSEEGKWINVDATFYKGGNYFNSKRFELDHKDANVVGEW